MRREILIGSFILILTIGVAPPAEAQMEGLMGSDLPAQALKNFETAMLDLRNQDALVEPQELESHFRPEELKAFFSGAVVKLTLRADGSFVASSRPGGDLVAFKLGKAKVAPGEAVSADRWNVAKGEYATPKRAAKLALTLEAGGQKRTIDCLNKYRTSDETVTFYVGPMRGLSCIGVAASPETDDEDPGAIYVASLAGQPGS